MTWRLPAILLALALCPAAAAAQPAPMTADPRIEQLVSTVSETRLGELVAALARFGTRHTLSDTTSPARGIGAARQWIFDELQKSSPRLHVSFDTFRIAKDGRITRDAELRNVLAVLPGRSSRRLYLSAHYDTVNAGGVGQAAGSAGASGQPPPDPQLRADQDYDIEAPGANDNGSGTALTMELARVFAASGLEFDATLVFALWAGEEQGMFGSRAHLQRLSTGKAVVDAGINNDIVGNSRGGNGVADSESVRVYSEGPEDSMSRALARYVRAAAAVYVPSHRIRLMARPDRFGRASDHLTFNDHGFASITFREANENFARQHAAADTADGVDRAYLARNARVNTAALASLALAPAAPGVRTDAGRPMLDRQPSGYDARLRWNPSPGAAGYRIYWRETWRPDWEHSRLVGNVTGFTLEGLSIDDYVFGVAAVGAMGHESLVSAYVQTRPSRGEVTILPGPDAPGN